MSDITPPTHDEVTVLGWAIPRPTGRWHQSIIVTAHHVWITPEISFVNNDKLVIAAASGLDTFHDFIRSAGWKTPPLRCALSEVRGVMWNDMTGWMRIAGADDNVIGAMIPNRAVGTKLKPLLKHAISSRVTKRTDRS